MLENPYSQTDQRCRASQAEAQSEPRRSVLMEAEALVNGARGGAYGHPRDNFGRICALWNAYLGGRPGGAAAPITCEDHAIMMMLVKVARLQQTPDHRDSVVDIAGYAATYEKLHADRA